MGLTVADVVEKSERSISCGAIMDDAYTKGYNDCLKTPLSPEKVAGMVEIDKNLLWETIANVVKKQTLNSSLAQEVTDAIISNQSKILGLKK